MASNTAKGGNRNRAGSVLGGILIVIFVVGVALFGPFSTTGTGTDTRTQERQATATPATTTVQLYHYTDCASAAAIESSGFIKPSIKSQGGYATFGDGIYLSDLPPTALLTATGYSWALFNAPYVVAKTACWILISVPQKEVKLVDSVYTNNLPRDKWSVVGGYGIYLRFGQSNLTLTKLDSGTTQYAR